MEKWISMRSVLERSQFAVGNLFITIGEVIHSIHGDKLPYRLSTIHRQEIQRLLHRVIHGGLWGIYIFWMLSMRSLMIL